jgi:LPS export ABC transporter protein LptC
MLLSACENDMQKVAALGRRTQSPEEAHGVDAYLSQAGKMKSRLLAPYMLRYQQDTPRIVFPESLHCDFYDSLLHIESILDARYGVYYENMNKVYLRDHVKIINYTKKDTIYCQDLYWDQNTGWFYTHHYVEVHGATQAYSGTGMRATQDFNNVIMDSASGHLKVQNDQLP